MSFKGTLLLALYAVGLTLVFLSHIDPPIAAHPKVREPPVLKVRMKHTLPFFERALNISLVPVDSIFARQAGFKPV